MTDFAAVDGEVVHGEGRGHGLGFPTINVRTSELPSWPHAVYAVQVSVQGEQHFGAMNWGPRPTFDETDPHVEVHLLDFEGDLYGERVIVHPVEHIRDIQHFASKEELMQAIQKDIEAVRAIMPPTLPRL